MPGFNVNGKVIPEILKPVPVSVGAYTVTGRLPVDVKITDCFTAVFTATLPNDKVVGLTPSICMSASTSKAKVFDTEPWVAFRVTAWLLAVHEEGAENAALVAFAGTVTLAGTVTTELLLERFTLSPPVGAAALNVTVQGSEACPAKDALLQEIALSVAVALALTAKGKKQKEIKRPKIGPRLSRHTPARLCAGRRLCNGPRLEGTVLVAAGSWPDMG